MIDERAYELLCCQLGLANEEKAGLRKQVNELIARLKAIEESNKENSKALVDTINDLKDSLEKQSTMVEHYRKEMELMRKQLEAKDEVNMMLANEISNLRLQLEDGRKHRFGRTSEQRRLLDNRNIDKSAMEKSEYDGSGKKGDDDNKTDGNGTGSNTSSGNVPAQNCRPSRKKETAPRAEKSRLKVDKVIVHEILLNNLREKVRVKMGQKAEASLGIMDSQSVRWGDNRSLNGIDGNKKVKGVKRHVVVDKNGFLLAVMVTIACVHDSKAAYLLARCLRELSCNIKVILADSGYRGEIAEKIKNAFGYILEVVVSGDKLKGFRPIGKRWIVERTFSWFDNYRRLCRNYELTFDSAEEMVKLASIRMLLNKI